MLGGNVFGWTADERTSFSILDTFVESGFNAIDTSDAYSLWVPGHIGGESEAVIGKWLQRRGRRDDVVIASKVGARPVAPGDGERADWVADLSARHILESVDATLARLRTDYIDLYQSHVDDEDTPPDEMLRAYETLISAGKVRAIGASNFRTDRLSDALAQSRTAGLPRYDRCQTRYNLVDRAEVESGLQNLCGEQHVGILCHSALAKGFLTGCYRTQREIEASKWRKYLAAYKDERSFAILDAATTIAAERMATVAQIALAWLLGRQAVAAAIVGVDNAGQWSEIAPAADIALSPDELAILNAATAQS